MSYADLSSFQTEDDVRGNIPPEPGIYHLAVGLADPKPVANGQLLDGVQFEFQVLDGTVGGQVNCKFRQAFFYPKDTAKDGGRFALQRLAMLGMVTEVIHPSQLGKPVDIRNDIPWGEAAGRHFIAEVYLEDEKYTKIKDLKMWHVNHPDAAKYPKDATVLEMMPMERQYEQPKPKAAAGDSASAAPAKAAPKPGAPRPGVKRPAAAAANGGGTATATAAAPAKAADPYGDL